VLKHRHSNKYNLKVSKGFLIFLIKNKGLVFLG
jgi:hypothetical protein